MRAVACVLALALVGPTVAAPVPPERTAEDAATERQLVGAWRGGPCVGTITFGADGRYTHTNYGPGASKFEGTWKVRKGRLLFTPDEPDRGYGPARDLKIERLGDELRCTYGEDFEVEYVRLRK